MEFLIIFQQMLVLFAMIAIGYAAYRKGWVEERAAKQISTLVVNVFNPMLVVNGVLGKSAEDGMEKIWINLALVGLYYVLLYFVSLGLPLALRARSWEKSAYRMMGLFANVGFLAIPVIRSIYGNDAMIYVSFYYLVYNVLLYTLGVRLAGQSARENGREPEGTKPAASSVKGALRQMMNPGVLGCMAAVVIFAAGVPVSQPVADFCNYMGNVTIPLSMILIGISVAQEDLQAVFTEVRLYGGILLRMVLLPILMALLLRPLVPDSMILGIFVLELSMPVGNLAAMLIKEKGGDDALCTRGIVLSTLASVVTIPLVCLFL